MAVQKHKICSGVEIPMEDNTYERALKALLVYLKCNKIGYDPFHGVFEYKCDSFFLIWAATNMKSDGTVR
jgi:hypothetical protein